MLDIYIGRKKANVLIDTGASKTVFDLNRIQHFVKNTGKDFERSPHMSTGLGTSELVSHLTTLSSLKIGNAVIKPYNAVLLDLSHVNNSYDLLGITRIDGVIGSDLLKYFQAQLNFRSRTIKIFY
jgi:predicted aspartyl protease